MSLKKSGLCVIIGYNEHRKTFVCRELIDKNKDIDQAEEYWVNLHDAGILAEGILPGDLMGMLVSIHDFNIDYKATDFTIYGKSPCGDHILKANIFHKRN